MSRKGKAPERRSVPGAGAPAASPPAGGTARRVVLAVLLVAGLGVSAWLADRSFRADEVPRSPTADTIDDATLRSLLASADEAIRTGDPGAALPTLFGLQRSAPGNVQIATALGRALRGVGRVPESDDVLMEALRQHPADPALRVEASLTREMLGDDAGALDLITAAVDAYPSLGEPLETRGMIHYRRGRWAEAQRDFDAAFRVDPARPWVLVHAGMARLEMEDPAGAEAYFARCVAADPGIGDAYAGLAIVAAQRGDVASAESRLAHSRHVEPGDTLLQTAAQTEIDAARAKAPPPR